MAPLYYFCGLILDSTVLSSIGELYTVRFRSKKSSLRNLKLNFLNYGDCFIKISLVLSICSFSSMLLAL